MPTPEIIKKTLDVGGVFGLAVLLAVPIVEVVVRQASRLEGRTSIYQYRLYRMSLLGLFGVILLSAAAWARHHWPQHNIPAGSSITIESSTGGVAMEGRVQAVINGKNGGVTVSNPGTQNIGDCNKADEKPASTLSSTQEKKR